MVDSCYTSEDFRNIQIIFKFALTEHKIAPEMFKLCIEKMSNRPHIYKGALIEAFKMIAKVIGVERYKDKFNILMYMLSGINTSSFGRTEDTVNKFFNLIFVFFFLNYFFKFFST